MTPTQRQAMKMALEPVAWRPLYTAPQPAKQEPLTDAQRKELIKTVAESIGSYSIIMTHWPLVIDAVEAAHGIGGR